MTYATGALSDGLHVLTGELEDASGTRTAFRVAVTIESSPSSNPPPVERSITSSGNWTLTVPGGLVTVKMPQSAWPTPPSPADYILVLRVDAGASSAGFAPGTQIVNVTARWALAGTYVTEFREPLEIIFSNPSGVCDLPWSANVARLGTRWPAGRLVLPAGRADGFYRDSTACVLTRYLTSSAGKRTTRRRRSARRRRWLMTASRSAGSGADSAASSPTSSSTSTARLPAVRAERARGRRTIAAGDTRTFTLAQTDAAGNTSARRAPASRSYRGNGTRASERHCRGDCGFVLSRILEEPS